VLIVDDEESMRLFLARILGHRAEAGGDARRNLRAGAAPGGQLRLRRDPARPDDAGIGGFEVLREIRQVFANVATPVIIVSALTDQAHPGALRARRRQRHVAKPVERNLLYRRSRPRSRARQAERRRKITGPTFKVENVEALGNRSAVLTHDAVKNAGGDPYIAGMLAPGDDFDAHAPEVFRQIATALASAAPAGATWSSSRPTSCIPQDIPNHGLADTRISDIFSGRKISAEYPSGHRSPRTGQFLSR